MNALETITNNFWLIFLMFTLVYPRLRQGALDRSRQRELTTLGRNRGSNVITSSTGRRPSASSASPSPGTST